MKNNIFGFRQESDNEEEPAFDPKSQKAQMNDKLKKMSEKSKKAVAEEMSKYIFDDPSIYTYDDHYEQIQNQRKQYEEKVLKINRPNQPKHIEAIREATEQRQREVSIVLERLNEKKLKQEGETFKNKEMFITSSYVEMMDKNKKYEQDQKKNEEYDKAHTVDGGRNMTDFWRNMYENGQERPDLNKQIIEKKESKIEDQGKEIINLKETNQQVKQKINEEINQSQQPAQQLKNIHQSQEPKQKSRSRSRSHSKEKEKQQINQQIEIQKNEPEFSKEEPVKQLTKEEKLELARKRYLERQQQKEQKSD